MHNVLKSHNQDRKNNIIHANNEDFGQIKLRFRLTEGREVQLFHKSNIEADLADLKNFELDGSLKPRVSIYNDNLRVAIIREIEAMREAYRQLKEDGAHIETPDSIR